MFRRLLLLLLFTLGCDDILGVFSASETTLTIEVAGVVPKEYNALDDPKGLGALHIELTGAVDRTFTAEDIPVEPFSVPDRGQVYVYTSLRLDGERISGNASWALEPDHKWSLRFARAATPPAASLPSPPGQPKVYCNWRSCEEYWRIEIPPDLRNYEEEALWVVLYGVEPCPGRSVCD